jgi:hypothetical protein
MPKDVNKRKVIDLRKATEADDGIYICEDCDIQLIPYYDIKGERLTRGKLYQCGRCGIIKDTSGDNLKRPEQLTARGDNLNIFFNQPRSTSTNKGKQEPYDLDKGDDLMLKGQGFHIVKTRITVGGKIVRND